jgi:hypothetical protein
MEDTIRPSTIKASPSNSRYGRGLTTRYYMNKIIVESGIDFEIVERCFEILSRKHNIINWFIFLGRTYFFESKEDALMCFDLGLNKVYLYHLKNLISFSDDFMHLYNILINDDIWNFSYDTFVYNWGTERTSKPITEDMIRYPESFIFWSVDDLIEAVYAYFTKDTVLDIDEIFSRVPIINDDVKQFVISTIDKYYFNRIKERVKVYEQELIEISCIPERVLDWYFDNEKKQILAKNFYISC